MTAEISCCSLLLAWFRLSGLYFSVDPGEADISLLKDRSGRIPNITLTEDSLWLELRVLSAVGRLLEFQDVCFGCPSCGFGC